MDNCIIYVRSAGDFDEGGRAYLFTPYAFARSMRASDGNLSRGVSVIPQGLSI